MGEAGIWCDVLVSFAKVRSNGKYTTRPKNTAATPTDGFDFLIKRAAVCIAISSLDEVDVEYAKELYQQAIDSMIKAAHSPFFGGTETTVSYEGLAVVREVVFECVEDELITRGFRI
jgi:hypothetical protein